MKRRALFILLTAASFVMLAGAPSYGGSGNAPQNPAAAKQEIIRAFEAWGAVATLEQVEANLKLIDDPRGVLFAAGQAQQNFPDEVANDTYRVSDVRFVSPTEAAVTYDIVLRGSPLYTGQIGHAVLKEGTWRLTRTTVCGDLALAGGDCDQSSGVPIVVTEATRTPSAPPAKAVPGRPALTG